MHLAGMFVNKDLFEAQNVEPLSYGYTLEDLERTVAAMSAPANGVVALKNADIVDWYPAVKNSSLGWFPNYCLLLFQVPKKHKLV